MNSFENLHRQAICKHRANSTSSFPKHTTDTLLQYVLAATTAEYVKTGRYSEMSCPSGLSFKEFTLLMNGS